eukprot:7927349-Ditylum_brightwellii.AAC.1
MLDEMEMKFNQIQDVLQELVFTTKQFTIQVFQSLFTSTNQDFLEYIKGKRIHLMRGRMSIFLTPSTRFALIMSTMSKNSTKSTQRMQQLLLSQQNSIL